MIIRDGRVLMVHERGSRSGRARYCDRIVLLAGGRVLAGGPPREVLTAGRIARVFGVAAEIGTDASGRPRVLRQALST